MIDERLFVFRSISASVNSIWRTTRDASWSLP
jgi:hypothetical protein